MSCGVQFNFQNDAVCHDAGTTPPSGESDTDQKLTALATAMFHKYKEEDYWGNQALAANQIQSATEQRDRAVKLLAEADVSAEQRAVFERTAAMKIPHREDVLGTLQDRTQEWLQEHTGKLYDALVTGDIEFLNEHVRYDQPITVEIVEHITGRSMDSDSGRVTNTSIRNNIRSWLTSPDAV